MEMIKSRRRGRRARDSESKKVGEREEGGRQARRGMGLGGKTEKWWEGK